MIEIQFKLPRGFIGRFITDEDIEIGEKEHMLLEAYVPGIEIISNSSRFDMTICYTKGDTQRMIAQGDVITLYGQWYRQLSTDIYHLISGVAREHYLSKNLFPVHAACVGLEKLILLTGHTNSGKTTVSLKLIEKFGMKMFSGNKTVIDLTKNEPLAIVGTKTITMNKKYSNNIEGFDYGNRIAFKLNKQEYINGGSLSCIVLVRLNSGVQDLEKLTPSSALHTLYPYFLDVANADVVIGCDVFNGITDMSVKKYLVERLRATLQNIPVYSVAGSLPFITEKIVELHK